MATKCRKELLAIRYQTKDDNGHIGPDVHILHGMGEKWRPLTFLY